MSEPDDNTDADDLVQSGLWGKIRYARDANGNMPAKDFVDGLSAENRARLAAVFDRLANHGQFRNPTRFKKLQGDLFECKQYQIRVGCFQEGRTWFLTHGFIKKAKRWKKSEVDRAERIMKEHRERTK